MCGLIGAVGPTALSFSPWVDDGLRRLAHRGPDGAAVSSLGDGRVILGHRRLSIIDLSHAGDQPMSGPHGICVAYNGEIYNYRELRDQLRVEGHVFTTASDTEVLLAAYLQWGRECVHRFVGMWAFALHDPRSNSLWMSRDPFGIKPLFHTRQGQTVLFASELGPLSAAGRHRIDAQVAYDFLRWGHVDRTNRTFLADIESLRPGHHLVIDDRTGDTLDHRAYWRPPTDRRLRSIPYPEAVEIVRSTLESSIALHLRSDVPVGTALSGGVDSSGIACLVREVGGPDVELRTVSYSADDARLNEDRFARLAIDAAGADALTVRVDPTQLQHILPEVEAAQFEPFASLSILAQHEVFRAARASGLTVMLDGQGADELFGGYPSFLQERLTDLLRRGRLVAAGRMARSVAAHHGSGGVARCMVRALPTPVATALWARWMHRSTPTWLDLDTFRSLGVHTGPHARDLPRSLAASLEMAVSTSSLPSLLRYEDRNSMAHSVESRVPFLTTELAELVGHFPDGHLIGSDGTTKRILRDALRGLVPTPILDRRDKVAFSVPEPSWLATLDISDTTTPGITSHPGMVPAWRRLAYERFVARTGLDLDL